MFDHRYYFLTERSAMCDARTIDVTRRNIHAQIYYSVRVFPKAIGATAFIGVWLGFLFAVALRIAGVI